MNAVTGENDIRKQTQLYGAVQYTFWDRFYTKFVFSYADAEFNPLSNPPPVEVEREQSSDGVADALLGR